MSADKVQAYVFEKQGAELVRKEVDQVPLGANDVEVDITVVSLCHTDLSLGLNDWKVSQYPLVAGHEAVGIVSKVGSEVKSHKVGDRVAIGWMRSSCGTCARCNCGEESQCLTRGGAAGVALIFSGPGAFADSVRVHERFAFSVPESLKSTNVAPLMCAGCTVYSPIANYCSKPGCTVLVIGVGGLGHLAIKLASKYGCNVIAASRGTRKAEQARELGASLYVDSTNEEEMKSIAGKVDVALFCASGGDVKQYFPTLSCGGTFVMLGAPPSDELSEVSLSVVDFIFGSKKFAGSAVAGSVHTNQLLNFCAVNKVGSAGTVLPIAELPKAMKTLHDSPKDAPFRYIFTTDKWNKEKDF